MDSWSSDFESIEASSFLYSKIFYIHMLTLVSRRFPVLGEVPVLSGLCLIAEETERGVTITILELYIRLTCLIRHHRKDTEQINQL